MAGTVLAPTQMKVHRLFQVAKNVHYTSHGGHIGCEVDLLGSKTNLDTRLNASVSGDHLEVRLSRRVEGASLKCFV